MTQIAEAHFDPVTNAFKHELSDTLTVNNEITLLLDIRLPVRQNK